jgi:hypothetical protein
MCELGLRWRCEFQSFESTVEAINKVLSVYLLHFWNTVLASPGGSTTLPRKSKGPEVMGANWHCGGDANFNRLKAALKLSISHFQRVF